MQPQVLDGVPMPIDTHVPETDALFKYRLDDEFEVSTGFRSPRKPMYRRPKRAARGRLFWFPR